MAKNKNPWSWMDTDRKFDDAYVNKPGGKRFFSFKDGSKLGKKLLKKGDIRAAKALFTRAGKAFTSYAKYKGFTPKKDRRPIKNGLRVGRNDGRTEPDLEDEYDLQLFRESGKKYSTAIQAAETKRRHG